MRPQRNINGSCVRFRRSIAQVVSVKYVLGFDPGISHWGLAVLNAETLEVVFLRSYSDGIYDFPKKQKESFRALERAVASAVRKYDPQIVCVEELPVGRGLAAVQQSIGMFLGLMFQAGGRRTYIRTTPTSWKKVVTGKGNTPKTKCRPHITRHTGWTHAEKYRIRPDEYDAIGVAIYGCTENKGY